MEDINPWLDPDSGKHKNKKSTKPKEYEDSKKSLINKEIKEKEEKEEKEKKDEKDEVEVSGKLKKNNDSQFLKVLLEDSLQPTLPKNVENWVIENFDAKWLEEFLNHVKIIREDILSSEYFPTEKELVLLKYIFLLQQN